MTDRHEGTGPKSQVTDGREGAGLQSTFRTTLLRVMLVQVVALALLWLLQARYQG